MKALINKLSMLLIALSLTSCGGGGGGGGGTGGAFQPPPGTAQVAALIATPSTGSIAAFSTVEIVIIAKNTDGTLAKDGTSIVATVTPLAIGTIANSLGGSSSTTASGLTVGGTVAFRFSSSGPSGTAHIVFSTTAASGVTVSVASDISVNAGPDPRLQAVASPVNISANSFSDIKVTAKNNDGTVVPDGTVVNAALSPSTIGSISGAAGQNGGPTATGTTIAGVVSFRFSSGVVSGVAHLVFSTVAGNGQTISTSVDISVAGGTGTDARLQVSSSASRILPNSFADIIVIAKKFDGLPVADGSVVNATINPASLGIISGATSGGSTTTATNTTIGGVSSFRFSSGGVNGTAHITVSTTTTSATGTPETVTANIDVTVNGSNLSDPRLVLTATTLNLPLNPQPGVFPSLSSPYIAEVTITRRHQNGALITGTEKDNTSITPVQIAAFSTLDDPATAWSGASLTPPTAEGNEFLTQIGSGPVNVTGGQGTLFVHAQSVPGPALLIVTAIDPDNGQTISSSLTFNIVSTIPPVPATISLSTDKKAAYTSLSGGNTSVAITALVQTGAGLPVADPKSGNHANDNIQFDIIGDNPGDARLSATNAAGVAHTQTSVQTRTTSGVASVQFIAGTEAGQIQVKATADRYDNDVSNGIQDPVTSTITIIVSDGKLYSLAISSPVVNGLKVNSISGQVTSSSASPADPNATYSVTESATATDRAGNPVLPTVINFGLIDAPASTSINFGNGNFLITGQSGDPKESDTLFTATGGHFKTAGGGAGPGDTLLVFGHTTTFDGYAAPVGNRDLEGARVIQSIATDTQLTVTSPFNPNDDTGQLTDLGAVIPYVIGHATAGNITASATTNAVGVATVFMTYPASHLGQYAYVWAQGAVSTTTGSKTVGDIAASGYPGLAPASLSVPSSIVGNTTTTLRVCVTDALKQPMAQQVVGFTFENLGNGRATIDGQPSGIFANPTDANGCVVGVVVTSGLSNAGTVKPEVVISADGQNATVTISVGGAPILQASPSAFISPNNSLLTLTLTDDHGHPISGVAISGTCTGTISITTILPTDANGISRTFITSNGLDAPTTPLTGSCTFTAADGATATVNVTGINTCVINRNAPGCPLPPQSVLTVVANDANVAPNVSPVAGSVTISGTSLNAPLTSSCSISGTGSVSCPNSFDQGTTVTLHASAVGTVGRTAFSGWAGGCSASGTQSATGGNSIFTMPSGTITCTANFTCTGGVACP